MRDFCCDRGRALQGRFLSQIPVSGQVRLPTGVVCVFVTDGAVGGAVAAVTFRGGQWDFTFETRCDMGAGGYLI